MAAFRDEAAVNTQGFSDVIDITPLVQEIVGRSGILNGIVCIASPGSTAGITTIEFRSEERRVGKEC
jgi:thiamine phosphate synthase YjbQ (UPF0047 family)